MKKKNIHKIYKEIRSLSPDELSKVRDKLIPIFLSLDEEEPYKDKKVINLLKRRYRLALKEYKLGKLVNAEKYLRKSLG